MTGPARTLVAVWIALLVLLALTIGATYTPIGPFKIVANMTIALAKAALIFWFYMHLREERGLARLAVIGAAVWLAILFLLISSDYVTRGWNAPAQ